MAEPVKVTMHNDAGCPWGYSANPAFRVLEWRYGAQLEWRLVLIGLTNVAQEYVDRGYSRCDRRRDTRGGSAASARRCGIAAALSGVEGIDLDSAIDLSTRLRW